MNFSAASSNSSVVMPGRILPWSRFIVFTSTAPAAAMRSISSEVFLMIPITTELSCGSARQLDVVLEQQRGDHRADVVVDLGGAARTVDAAHQALLIEV